MRIKKEAMMEPLMTRWVGLAGALALLALPAFAQQYTVAHPPAPAGARKLRVYLDCNYCDFDFLRTEITFVDYVRNRQDAQVHILVTNQQTGGGGTEFTFHFIGLRELATLSDTLKYNSPPAASPDNLRRGFARVIRIGLVRYASRLGDISRFDVTYTAPAADSGTKDAGKKDPWNYWVFRATANGFASGEKANNFVNLNGSVSANRVTEAWKTNLTFYANY